MKPIHNKLRTSNEVLWKLFVGEEYFHFIGRGWSVTKAKEIIIKNPREIVYIDPNAFEPLLGGLTSSGTIRMGVSIDRSRLKLNNIDLSIPLIIIEYDNGMHMLIDGWHRLAKALDKKLDKIPAVILSPDETREITLK